MKTAGMGRKELNLLVDWALLAASIASFATGLVLFFYFHVGHGTFH